MPLQVLEGVVLLPWVLGLAAWEASWALGVRILLVVGIVGALMSMIFWSSWAGPGYFTRRRPTYVEEGPPVDRIERY